MNIQCFQFLSIRVSLQTFFKCFSVQSDQPEDDQRGNAKEPRAASGTIKLYFYIFFIFFSNLKTFLQQTFQYCLSLIDFKRKDSFKYLLFDSFFSLACTRIQNAHFSFELFIVLGFRHSRRLHVEGGCVERLQEVCDARRRRMCILFARNRNHIHQLVHIHQQLVHIHQQLVQTNYF